MGRGACTIQYVITYQQNHIHYTNCYNGPSGWELKRVVVGEGDSERGCIVNIC